MTPGILPFAPPGPRRFASHSDSLPANLSNHHFVSVVLIHLNETSVSLEAGGGRWIRTTEGVSQQIYSLPPLAAWVSLRKLLVFSN